MKLLIIASLLLAGCARLPPCDRYKAMVGEDQNGQPVVAIDMDNVVKLVALIQGLSAGTCRLEMGEEV